MRRFFWIIPALIALGLWLANRRAVVWALIGASSGVLIALLLDETTGALLGLHSYNPALAVVGRSRQMPATLNLAGLTLAKLRGWTHLQLACSLEAVHQAPPDVEIQPVTAATLAAFAALHAEGFHRDPAVRAVNEASFSGLLEDPCARLSLLYAEGRPVAGAALFCASNGVALGLSTTKSASQPGSRLPTWPFRSNAAAAPAVCCHHRCSGARLMPGRPTLCRATV